jgi:hypothetical protein
VSVLDDYPRKLPGFTAASCPSGNVWKLTASGRSPSDGPALLLYRTLVKLALKNPGFAPWRMCNGVEIGIEYRSDDKTLILTIQRCYATQGDAVAKFGNEVAEFLRGFNIQAQVLAQRIVDERHLAERSLRWLGHIGQKAEALHG